MKTLVFIFLFFPLMSFAQSDTLSQEALLYGVYCTPIDILLKSIPADEQPGFLQYVKSAEFLTQRAAFQNFLKSPAQELKKMIDKSDGMSVVLTCAVVEAIQERIAKNGCTAEDGSTFTATDAVTACKPILDDLSSLK